MTNGNNLYLHHHAIQKKHHVHAEQRRRLSSGSKRDYKKSVSTSLVYRSLKFDKDGYVGFKVTYSGKGVQGNYNKSNISVILVPDLNFIRAYRPIAGAIARATKGEVLACSYSSRGGINEMLISLIIERMKFVRSKLRSVNLISENQDILELFRSKLNEVDRLVDSSSKSENVPLETPEGESVDDSFQDAPSSPQAIPRKITVSTKQHPHQTKKRRVQLIRISRRGDKKDASGHQTGVLSRLVKSVFGKLGSIFTRSSTMEAKMPESKFFQIDDKFYKINDKLNFGNASHCDLIAGDMLGIVHT